MSGDERLSRRHLPYAASVTRRSSQRFGRVAFVPLREIRWRNPLLFDLVLERRVRSGAARFAPDVFATRRHFAAASSTVAGASTPRRRPNE